MFLQVFCSTVELRHNSLTKMHFCLNWKRSIDAQLRHKTRTLLLPLLLLTTPHTTLKSLRELESHLASSTLARFALSRSFFMSTSTTAFTHNLLPFLLPSLYIYELQLERTNINKYIALVSSPPQASEHLIPFKDKVI